MSIYDIYHLRGPFGGLWVAPINFTRAMVGSSCVFIVSTVYYLLRNQAGDNHEPAHSIGGRRYRYY